jgi:hypothetical protein
MHIEEGYIQDISEKNRNSQRVIVRKDELTLYAFNVPLNYKVGQFIQILVKDNIVELYDPVKFKKDQERIKKERIAKLKEYREQRKLLNNEKKIIQKPKKEKKKMVKKTTTKKVEKKETKKAVKKVTKKVTKKVAKKAAKSNVSRSSRKSSK